MNSYCDYPGCLGLSRHQNDKFGYCDGHRLPTMIKVESRLTGQKNHFYRTCRFYGCNLYAKWGYKDRNSVFCGAHAPKLSYYSGLSKNGDEYDFFLFD